MPQTKDSLKVFEKRNTDGSNRGKEMQTAIDRMTFFHFSRTVGKNDTMQKCIERSNVPP